MAKRTRQPGRADMDMVRELDLFSQNDSTTYERCYYPLVKAAIKHAEKGNFNEGKLCNAIRKRCVPFAIQQYSKQLGTVYPTTADRNVLGAYMCKHAIEDVKDEIRNK